MKRKAANWRKYANQISDKELESYIYIFIYKLNRQVANNPTMKWAKDMNGRFTEEDTEMANAKAISKTHFTTSISLQK